LVFSHWKFVPKAISIIVSREAERKIPKRRKGQKSVPLQFRSQTAFYPFDVCYPSRFLAAVITQLNPTSACTKSAKQIFVSARIGLEKLISEANIIVKKARSAPLWQIIARLEAFSANGYEIEESLKKWRGKAGNVSEHLPVHIDQYLRWMQDRETTLVISPRWVRRLISIALYSPAICTLRALTSLGNNSEWPLVLDLCFNQLRTYFNKPLVQAVCRNHGGSREDSYTERVIGYCRKAHFQAVMDEYVYLVHNVLQRREEANLIKHLGRVFALGTGQPPVNCLTRTGRMRKRPVAQVSHFALAFGEEISGGTAPTEGKTRRAEIREAFNSPFWPFTLATTSVGQEGLDLHLYCRNVVHWNLPSNPVDLEQREGRINRFDSLRIRQNVARDVPISRINGLNENPWKAAFRIATAEVAANGEALHGLSPHWIYQGNHASGMEIQEEVIRRHVLFYAASADVERYQQLKRALSIYRLVLGQPRQQDMIEQLLSRLSGSTEELAPKLAEYMINLSPLPGGKAPALSVSAD